MTPTTMLRGGAVLAALGVAAGAFGAHTLADHLDAKDLQTFEVAVRYQLFGALALCALAALPVGDRRVAWAARLLGAGTIVFSGTLYALLATGVRWFGAITPVGGVLLLAGWLLLATVSLPRRDAPRG